ncbi:PLAT domain-containing protein 3-like [Solanum stenotomum]|uniref:PLAT domain-containing protein 3-like n=1 Tax=Solanum stenotomum TaxID=172797 RepID=UPI0020D196E7|nr:PLAT domain-containing protein 3-like [Solanum stenotomum]
MECATTTVRKPIKEKMRSLHLLIAVAFTFFLSAHIAAAGSSEECVYTLYVRTGSIIKGGTDSKISVTLGDASGKSVWIPDLEKWGLMGPNYDYYERGNVDIFTGRGKCLSTPICRLNVTSDGSGDHHGWFLDYVETTFTGPHMQCNQTIFYVEQWLASDAPPYELSVSLDGCKKKSRHHARRFVVGNKPIRSASE